MSDDVRELRERVLEITLRIHADGLIAGSSGNVSARVPGRALFAVTPSGLLYHRMTAADIVVVDGTGAVVLGARNPSNETPVHLAIYRARPDAGCVLHTHAVYSTALSLLRLPIPPVVDEMVVHLGGEIAVAEYGAPGTADLGEKIVRALGERNAVLLANHGNVVLGRDPEAAYKNAHVAERAAQAYAIALATGRPVHSLPEDVLAAERQIFRRLQAAGGKPERGPDSGGS